MNKKSVIFLMIIFLGTMMPVVPLFAASVALQLDQSIEVGNSTSTPLDTYQAQSFRPDYSNVGQIDVDIYNIMGSVDLSLWLCTTFDGNVPTSGEILASTTIPSIQVTFPGDWVPWVLTTPVVVEIDEQYWIVAHSDGNMQWWYGSTTYYDGSWYANGLYDCGIRTYYEDTFAEFPVLIIPITTVFLVGMVLFVKKNRL